ncbi:MAG TPA: ROK family protein [Bacteroidota bacterium]|nr:ROK family protein [Bacteroidota bacterium]
MILGLDIGGTKTAVLLGTEDGQVQWRKQFATGPSRGFRIVYDEIVAAAAEAIRTAGERQVECIGVSIGGPMDSLTGVIKSPPNLPHWDNIPLKQMLQEKFSLPVYVEHDGNAGALAEWYFGAGKGFSNIVFITMGTGFGAGFILDGRLYRGTSNTAGEVGHIRIAEDGPKCFGKAGSLEGYGSGTGMALLARTMFPKRYDEFTTVQDVYRDFKNNSAEAAEVFTLAGKYVGRGLAIIADMINPECIILGGLGMRIGDAINGPMLEAFNAEALKESASVCSIVPAKLGETIGDIAAISAALYQQA